MLTRSDLIWATRGRNWGFRFLLDAGLSDPLQEYERAFAGVADEANAWGSTDRGVAVRFLDPKLRRDTSGRFIPHEFVVLGNCARLVNSVEEGKRQLWPLVEFAFEQAWDADSAPTAESLRFE